MRIDAKWILLAVGIFAVVAVAGTLVDQGKSGSSVWPVSISSAVSGSANGSWVYLDGGVAAVTQSGSWTVTTTPPSNASTNVTQLGGNAIATGSGVLGTGTQRVVLATDQPVVPVSDNSGSLTVDGTVAVSSVSGSVTVATTTAGGSPGSATNEGPGSVLISEAITVPSNGTPCTAPAGASCTLIWGTGGYSFLSFTNLTITVTNTGANALTNVIISWDTNGSNLEAWDTTTFAALAAGTTLSLAMTGNSRRYLKIYGRSASGTTTTVVVTANGRSF